VHFKDHRPLPRGSRFPLNHLLLLVILWLPDTAENRAIARSEMHLTILQIVMQRLSKKKCRRGSGRSKKDIIPIFHDNRLSPEKTVGKKPSAPRFLAGKRLREEKGGGRRALGSLGAEPRAVRKKDQINFRRQPIVYYHGNPLFSCQRCGQQCIGPGPWAE